MRGVLIGVATASLAAVALAGCSPEHLYRSGAFRPPPASDLPSAFAAAFGGPPPVSQAVGAPGGAQRVLVYRPSGFVVLAPQLVALISTGSPPPECHACTGALAVSYLTHLNGQYQPVGQWFDVGVAGPPGEPPAWKAKQDLFAQPAIEADASNDAAGCRDTSATLVELTGDGPHQRVSNIVVAASNAADGPGKPGADVAYVGNIVPDVQGRSFAVKYAGTFSVVTKWTNAPVPPSTRAGPWRQIAGPTPPNC